MKSLLKTVSVLILIICISCKRGLNDELLKKEFSSFLMQYYFNYPAIKGNNDMQRFIKYVNANHDVDVEIVKEKNYTLRLDSIARILYVESKNGLLKLEAKINLDDNDINVLGDCSGDKMITGFYSKKMKMVFDSSFFMKKIHDAIGKVSNDTLGIPLFDKKGSLKKETKALFMYEKGKVSVSCIKNDMSEQTIEFIKKELLNFLINQKELPIDYAIIPIEIKH